MVPGTSDHFRTALDTIRPKNGWDCSSYMGLSTGHTLLEKTTSDVVYAELEAGHRERKIEVIRGIQNYVNFTHQEKIILIAQVWRLTHRLEPRTIDLSESEVAVLEDAVRSGHYPVGVRVGGPAEWEGITTLFSYAYWFGQEDRDKQAVQQLDQFFEWTLRSKGDPCLTTMFPQELRFLRDCRIDGRLRFHGCEELLRETDGKLEIRVEGNWLDFSKFKDTPVFDYKPAEISAIANGIETLQELVDRSTVTKDKKLVVPGGSRMVYDINSVGQNPNVFREQERALVQILHDNGWRIETRGKDNHAVINFGHVDIRLDDEGAIRAFSEVTLKAALLEVKDLKWKVGRFSINHNGLVPWNTGRWEKDGRRISVRDLEPVKTISAEEIKANGGIIHQDECCTIHAGDLSAGESLVLATGSRTMKRSMSGHSWIRVYVPNDEGGYDFYPLGFMPMRQPKGAVKAFKYMAHPDKATTVVYPDQSEYRQDRVDGGVPYALNREELERLWDRVDELRDQCDRRELPFETFRHNCSNFVWQLLSDTFEVNDLDRFFEMDVFKTQSPGVMNLLKGSIGGIRPKLLRRYVLISMLQLFRVAPQRYREDSIELMKELIADRFGEAALADVPSAVWDHMAKLQNEGTEFPIRFPEGI